MKFLLEQYEKILLTLLFTVLVVSAWLTYRATATTAQSNLILLRQDERVQEINAKQVIILERLAAAEAKLDAVLLMNGQGK